ncbi:hypothetical protein C357_00859 [Citreicella sp. 357]|nr:hypothetical protein C357_00859 [Citreicella sp. 357]
MASLAFIEVGKLSDLLKSLEGNGNVFVRVLTSSQLAVGADPLNPTNIIDFHKEAIRPFGKEEDADGYKAAAIDVVQHKPARRLTRQTGRYILDFMGNTTECGSLKELLNQGLMALEAHERGVLEQLSAIKPRTKRIVARDPSLLFDRAELAEKYSERLMEGWWYGTNNSADETSTWLQRGAEIAGLKWGKEMSVSI